MKGSFKGGRSDRGKRFEGRSSGERGFGGRGGSRSFGDRDRRPGGFGGRDGARPTMHQATCSNCGKSCEVPFRPTGDKPVYCSECFGKMKPSDSPRYGEKRFDQPRFGDKKMFSAVCSSCGNRCEVPFRPTGDKPVYCSNCFGKNESGGATNKNMTAPRAESYDKQFKMLNEKLDQILRFISNPSKPKVAPTVTAAPAAKEEIKVKKSKAVKKAVKKAKKK